MENFPQGRRNEGETREREKENDSDRMNQSNLKKRAIERVLHFD